ncbi:AHH domain-containing protein, partial [Pseudoalteromonas sp. S558]|uniref:AHH domain-containing protein n=1 Tax=Pseudoalteromonas sp. S558 TaxID=2066515 RepID=UPI00127C7346
GASKEKVQRDYNHFHKDRKRLEHLLIAQQSLESYRAESEGSSVKELAEEEHHPTEKLAKFLRAAGEPKPTSYHEAHHIVCGKGRYRQRLTYAARLRMHSYGIGIKDPTNGEWLRNFEKNKSDD